MRTQARGGLLGVIAVVGLSGLLAVLVGVAAWPRRVAAGAATAVSAGEDGSPDRVCQPCHAAIYRSYEQTSMATGSGDAARAVHAGSFFSDRSQVLYRVTSQDGVVKLRSRREDADRPLDDTETLLYFIGSGKHGRTYLFRRELPGSGGALWYETPINWYTRRNSYGMAPAYDDADHAPLALKTNAGCLHCHASGVATSLAGVGNLFAGQPFRGGIGCSACHGDAAAHVASGGKTALVDLTKLPGKRRDSVCLQCHLEGDAMVQRAGREITSFAPGEDLDDVAMYFVDRNSAKSATRAASQYEALLRSACRRAAGDRLGCTTCHDPHSTPAPTERVAYFRQKCLGCHNEKAGFVAAQHHPEQADCASCHMPVRKVSDISHEQNANHDIEIYRDGRPPAVRPQDGSGRLARGTDLAKVGDGVAGDRELGLAYAQFAERGDRGSFDRALALLRKAESEKMADWMVHEQLGFLLQMRQDRDGARAEYEEALRGNGSDVTARTNLAILKAQAGQVEDAIRDLGMVAKVAPDQTPALLNLAILQCVSGSAADAKGTLERALHFQPDSTEARQFLKTGSYAGIHCTLR